MHLITSKCSWNHFNSEKYKTVQSLQLHFLQNIHLVQLYTSASDYEGFGNIPAILWNPFQLFRSILNDLSNITKVPSLHGWFQLREQVKISCGQVGRVCGMLQCCDIVLCYEILDQNRPVCWSIVVKGKPNFGSTIFGAFPSDRFTKTTEDVNVHFFIIVAIPVNYITEIL